jgi:hypothetical protein
VKRFKTLDGDEIGLPIEFEKRWSTHSVAMEDHGDHLVIRPVGESSELPDDEWPDLDSPATRRGGVGSG